MIGREDDDRIVAIARRKQRLHHGHHLVVDVLQQLIVVPEVHLQRCRIIEDGLHPFCVAFLIGGLRVRLGREIVALRLAEQIRIEQIVGDVVVTTKSKLGSWPVFVHNPHSVMSCGFTNDATTNHGALFLS